MGSLWKQGLLGFATGVTGALAKEYEDINKEKGDIREEDRANARELAREDRATAREIAAEQRRALLEQQKIDYAKRKDIEYIPLEEQARVQAVEQTGGGAAVAQWKAQEGAKQEEIRSGRYSEIILADQMDFSRAARIRAELSSEVALSEFNEAQKKEYEKWAQEQRKELARFESTLSIEEKNKLAADAKALEHATTDSDAEREREISKQRRLGTNEADQEIPPSTKGVNVSFTKADAEKRLRQTLSSEYGEKFLNLDKHLADTYQERKLPKLTGKKQDPAVVAKVFDDPDQRLVLEMEIAQKLMLEQSAIVTNLAKDRQITDITQVDPYARGIKTTAEGIVKRMEHVLKNGLSGSTKAEGLEAERVKLNEWLSANMDYNAEENDGLVQVWNAIKQIYNTQFRETSK